MTDIWTQIQETVVSYAPNLLGALAILIVGWIVALAVSALVRAALQRVRASGTIGRALAVDPSGEKTVPRVAGRVTFYLLMLLVLVAFFQALKLTLITEPLNELLTGVLTYAPKVVGALVLVFLAWIAARVVRFVVTRASRALKLDERIGENVSEEAIENDGLTRSMGEVAYWLVFLLFLPGILGTLQLEGLLAPAQDMTTQLFGFLPNLFGAAVVLLLGWLVAKLVQRIVTRLLASAGADGLAERSGLDRVLGKTGLSGLVGYVLYFVILLPVLISALTALRLESVTRPANQMLAITMEALPSVFAAGVLLGVSYLVGRFLSSITVNLVARVGVNSLLGKLGFPNQSPETGKAVAETVGTVVFAGVMLFAAIEAFGLLQFQNLAGLLTEFMAFLGQVLLGLFLLAVGLIFANLVGRIIEGSGAAHGKILAPAARVAVIVLSASMALRQMGLANEIVTLAFSLLIGAIAVAVAIAFGLGGREAAAVQINEWRQGLKRNQS